MPVLKVGMCPALTKEIFDAFQSSGLSNVCEFIATDLEEITQRSGVSYKEVAAIKRVLLAQYSAFPINSADLYDDVVSSVAILSSGCPSVDNLLDGGLYTAEVTEVIGPAGCGKTQFCLNTSLTLAKDSKQNVVYMDTGGGFDIHRFQELLESRMESATEQEVEQVCSRIRCSKVFDVFSVLSHLEEIKQSLSQQADSFYSGLKLVILDCAAAVISPILGGQQTDGHGFMMHLARSLKCLAVEYSVAVLVTNNVVYDKKEKSTDCFRTYLEPHPQC